MRDLRKVSMKLTPGCFGGTEVRIGNIDVASALRGLTLRASLDNLHVLELDVLVHDISAEADGTLVTIPDATHKLLVELGWTPPPPPPEAED